MVVVTAAVAMKAAKEEEVKVVVERLEAFVRSVCRGEGGGG